MPRRNVADIAPDHLSLALRLAFMLPRAVIETVMNHRAAAIVPLAGGLHQGPLQVASGVLHSVPCTPVFSRSVLSSIGLTGPQITPPQAFIADVIQPRQHAG